MKLTITTQFQAFLESIGIKMEDVLEKAKVANKLWQEEVNLNAIEYYNMLVELDKRVPEVAIRDLSNVENIQMFMPPLFAALSSKNGVEAVKRFEKFKKIIGPVHIEYIIDDKIVEVRFSYVHREQELPKFAVLNEQLLLLSIIRKGTGESIVPLLVETPFDYDAETIKLIGIEPQKENHNRIVFAVKDLNENFLTYNNLMYSYLEPELNRQLALVENEKSFTNYVQKELMTAIPSGFFKIEDIAEKLGISSRTLQRNLGAENTTFKEQVQMIQKSMAIGYLNLGVSTEEIAYLVGYTESSAFLRAFKKWTGKSLTQYKNEMNIKE